MPAPRGIPEAYVRIWNTVERIPKGRVSTYGTIARLAGCGEHARLVGYALHALPDGSPVPWHRVINARGRISFPPGSAAAVRQKRALAAEGVKTRSGRTDFELYLWPPAAKKLLCRKAR